MNIDFRFDHPSTFLICGSSGTGKSFLAVQFILNKAQLLKNCPSKILLLYREWQPIYEQIRSAFPDTVFYQNYPASKSFHNLISKNSKNGGTLIFIDDLYINSREAKIFDIENLFCVQSHHLNVTVIMSVHHLFEKNFRKVSLNSKNIFLTNSPRDRSQVGYLARQAFPGTGDF